jgi:hypothetical protein
VSAVRPRSDGIRLIWKATRTCSGGKSAPRMAAASRWVFLGLVLGMYVPVALLFAKEVPEAYMVRFHSQLLLRLHSWTAPLFDLSAKSTEEREACPMHTRTLKSFLALNCFFFRFRFFHLQMYRSCKVEWATLFRNIRRAFLYCCKRRTLICTQLILTLPMRSASSVGSKLHTGLEM